jgi:hypothetical protein
MKRFFLVIATLFAAPAFAQEKQYTCINGVCYEVVSSTTSVAAAKQPTFRQNLIAAAEKAFEAKEISRAELFRLRFSSLSPANLARLETAVREQAVSDGYSPNAIDWVALIRELLPIILEIIKALQ